MRRVIYKYQLQDAITVLELSNPEVRLVAQQNGGVFPTVWVEHDDPADVPPDHLAEYQFQVVGTGHAFGLATKNRLGSHVGSAICGEFVWHVYLAVT